jgi:hypothetical protein
VLFNRDGDGHLELIGLRDADLGARVAYRMKPPERCVEERQHNRYRREPGRVGGRGRDRPLI